MAVDSVQFVEGGSATVGGATQFMPSVGCARRSALVRSFSYPGGFQSQ